MKKGCPWDYTTYALECSLVWFMQMFFVGLLINGSMDHVYMEKRKALLGRKDTTERRRVDL